MMMRPRRTGGFTLVELMISITLGLLLSAAILQAFVATRSSYRVQEALSQIQVASRLAIHFIGKDMRMAGYMGCASLDVDGPTSFVKDPDDDLIFNETTMVVGFDNLPANNDFEAVAGTDAVTVRMATASSLQLTGNMASDNANIQVSINELNLVNGDVIMITDCETTDMFRATTVSKGQGKVTIVHSNANNISNRLSKTFGPDAELVGFESVSYYVRDTGRTTSDGAPIRALYVKRRTTGSGGLVPNGAELVEGVENMQITYGEDTNDDGSIDVYRDASAVAAWERVVSVKIELLVASQEENVVTQTGSATAQEVTFQGAALANNDGRYRKSLISVFAIRNRLD